MPLNPLTPLTPLQRDRLWFLAAVVLISLAVNLATLLLGCRLGVWEHHCREGRYVVREFPAELIYELRTGKDGHLKCCPLWKPAFRQLVWSCPHSNGGP